MGFPILVRKHLWLNQAPGIYTRYKNYLYDITAAFPMSSFKLNNCGKIHFLSEKKPHKALAIPKQSLAGSTISNIHLSSSIFTEVHCQKPLCVTSILPLGPLGPETHATKGLGAHKWDLQKIIFVLILTLIIQSGYNYIYLRADGLLWNMQNEDWTKALTFS